LLRCNREEHANVCAGWHTACRLNE
jgi:hypothetical protein